MRIRGMEMRAVVRGKTNYGPRSAYYTEYEDGEGNRHITATMIDNHTGDKSMHWYFGVGVDGLHKMNEVAIMGDVDFASAEQSDTYVF